MGVFFFFFSFFCVFVRLHPRKGLDMRSVGNARAANNRRVWGKERERKRKGTAGVVGVEVG